MASFSSCINPSNLALITRTHHASTNKLHLVGNQMQCRAVLDSGASFDSGSTAIWRNYSTESNAQRQFISTNYNGAASIDLNVEPLLHLVEEIVKEKCEADQKSFKFDTQELQHRVPGLSQLIHKITCEVSYDCAEKGNANERANSLLNLLSNYSPDTKIILVLAAFAICYGDFMVTVNQYANKSDRLVNSLVLLKQVTGTLESENTLKSQITTLKNIINILLGIVYYILELKSFRSWNNIQSEIRINEIIYWMMKTVVLCGFTVSDLCSGYTLRLNEKSELAISTQKITHFYEQLTTRNSIYCKREDIYALG